MMASMSESKDRKSRGRKRQPKPVNPKTWTKEEDEKLLACVEKMGGKTWLWVASQFPGRSHKQCHNRYTFQLRPRSKEQFTHEEDIVIIALFLEHGTRWSKIAKHLPHRTSNQIKNRYNSSLKKRFANNEFVELVIAHNLTEAKKLQDIA